MRAIAVSREGGRRRKNKLGKIEEMNLTKTTKIGMETF